jgi:parvulin-like peptidyl-prolyl isomerase
LLDGTQVRARHILLKVAPDASAEQWEQAASRLRAIRIQIQDGHLTFEEAVRQYSQGPSAAKGGDVGFFAHRGTMPASFADAAFDLKPRQLSDSVRTHAGLHVIEVTEERPGQLSLEDVRETVFDRLSEDLWEQQVARERSRARIEWVRPEDAPKTP